MNCDQIERIVIAKIRVANPRSRSKAKFRTIVSNIGAVGLKKPITVSRRAMDPDGTCYDVVCGQGRIEACLALGERTIPAIITDKTSEERYLMGLVENMARRPPSNRALFREVRSLLRRNNSAAEIGRKIGFKHSYAAGIVHLVQHGEQSLLEAVESGRLPLSIAIKIATGDDSEIQIALSQAYEAGELRGSNLMDARRIIMERVRFKREMGAEAQKQRRLTGHTIVREYRKRVQEQHHLLARANCTKDSLLTLTSVMRRLFDDENFCTLLRAENLTDLPACLALRMNDPA
jgi:ParB family chromosome partitioning protein